MSMKYKDLKLCDVFKGREPSEKNEDYYMVIRHSLLGRRALRLRDGWVTEFNANSDVAKIDINVLDLITEVGGE